MAAGGGQIPLNAGEGMEVEGIDAVAVSYPGFAADLESLRVN